MPKIVNIHREPDLPINKVINGNFDFWQRGTSFTSLDNYTADRFFAGDNSASASFSINRVEDVPTESNSTYSMKLEVSANGSLASGDTLRVQHSIEGNFFKDLFEKEVTFSFWVKSNTPGVFTFGLVTSSSTTQRRAYGTEYTIDQPDTWEKKNITIDFSGETIDNILLNENKAFDIIWGLDGGSSRQFPSLDGWIDAATLYSKGSSSQNWAATIGNTFFLSDVMMYEAVHGEVEFSRAGRNYAEELQLCQRYFERISGTIQIAGQWTNTIFYGQTMDFAVEKRARPTMSTGPLSGFRIHKHGVFQATWSSLGVTLSSISNRTTKNWSIVANKTGETSLEPGQWTILSSGYVDADAEL